jgi:uncharacterized integral membrane protein (TIGR00697 family)
MKNKRISTLQLILTIIFTVCFLISNIIATKQITLPFGITMTAAIILFPVVYILSDVFSEVYGYEWSRNTRYIAFISNLFMVLIFELVIYLPSAATFTGQQAMQQVLGSTPRVLIASLTAYFIGDLVNDKVFARMKKKHKDIKGFEARAILSSLLGEIVDSAIFLPIVFMGVLPVSVIILMAITQVLLKVGYEILILPLTKVIVKKAVAYEEKNQ